MQSFVWMCTKGGDTVDAIIAALISGIVTLAGVLIANGKSQAVTDVKIEELTREVRKHNSFAEKIPVIEEQIKVANHRIDDLEHINQLKGD